MKTDDIFEALTDIDDKFIAAAHPAEYDDGQPVVVRPAQRKPIWKTLVPVAACLAVIGTAGAFGAKYIKERMNVEAPDNMAASNGEMLSQSGGGTGASANDLAFEEIKLSGNTEIGFTMEEFPYYAFVASYKGVLLGDMVPLISADLMQNLFLCDMNGDGKRELCATVINNGLKSVEILDFASGDSYTSGRKWTEAYLRVDYNADIQTLMMYGENLTGTCMLTGVSQPSLDLMTHIFANTAETVPIVNQPAEFGMEELPGKYFVFENSAVYMCDNSSADTMLKKIMETGRIFLADLNGDGKRELCGQIAKTVDDDTIEIEIQVTACDIANGETYFKAFVFTEFKWPVAEVVEVVDGKLMLRKYDEQNETKFDRSPLTLDALENQAKPDYEEIPLVIDRTFTLPDFEGFTFTVDASTDTPTFIFNWEDYNNNKGVSNNVYSVFLCDLDGDGRREIVMHAGFVDLGCIKVYGFMDDGEMGEAVYFENGGYLLVEGGDELLYGTSDGKFEPLVFSKSDLRSLFMNGYDTEIITWDHKIDISELVPSLAGYDIRIEQKRLSISLGDKEMFNSECEISEMYRIPDMENDLLFFVYRPSDSGNVCVVKITENNVEHTDLGGFTLKPTPDRLLLIDADGVEVPFVLERASSPITVTDDQQ